ncbi:unnamed protein product [Rotaria magnacalcarata]|uniref:Uncharacterized protein n=2 Tax=Rotaria magnacalcarata TaxID=392030 RepID=A0A816KXH7_9BILA|nr:unnamed protein product [Rotaria magnacalcarata]CAF1927210.1 unnamed protein product [Rotaria magnacalcarata]CAF1983564.1 unnamed protein product [Rotaria magnacalcarata]CAF3898242.1 unnamed protein product [Rotaria magnacalcarata]CAF3925612.1 unnamed protein product [Rotaria magnacalcarata]
MMFDFIKGFSSFILIILTNIITGPISIASNYYLIKSDSISTSLTSCNLLITISFGLMDSILYGIGLYLSMRTVYESHDQRTLSNKQMLHYHERFESILIKEKHLLEPVSQQIDILIQNQINLDALIKDLVNDNYRDQPSIENILNKLTTLNFIQNDSIITIQKNIKKSIRLLKLNSTINENNPGLNQNYFGDLVLSNDYLYHRIYSFIFSISFLIYIHQILLWFFQYLTLKNPEKYISYSLILSIVIIFQSLTLIYFIEITNTFHYLSPLYIYTCLFFIRSFITIYQNCFSIH